MALEFWRRVAHAQTEWHKRRGHGCGGCHPEHAQSRVRDCFSQMSYLAIASRVAGDLGGSHGGYHVLDPDLAAKLAQAFFHHDNRLVPHLAVAVHLVDVKRRAGFRVIPAFLDGEGDEIWRAPVTRMSFDSRAGFHRCSLAAKHGRHPDPRRWAAQSPWPPANSISTQPSSASANKCELPP